MDCENLARRVTELAAEEAGVDPADVSPATHFIDDLHFDSLDGVQFTMAVEDEFEISIPDADAEKLQTVGSVIEYVRERVKDVPTVKA